MPAYDFKCKSCEKKFTIRVSIDERHKVKCPYCGQGELVQLFTGINIIGTGGNNCDAPRNSRFT